MATEAYDLSLYPQKINAHQKSGFEQQLHQDPSHEPHNAHKMTPLWPEAGQSES